MLDIIRKAADRIGGVPRLADRIGVTRQAIYQWREIPAERVREIATLTGVARADLRPDLYATGDDEAAWAADSAAEALSAAETSALRADRLQWLEAQAEAIAAGSIRQIDVDALVALLRSLSVEARAEVERRLRVILVRLLKWRHCPDRRSLSTVGVITAERARVLARFAGSPSLREHAGQALARVYLDAVEQVCQETGLARDAIPADCPFSLDEVLDPRFASVTVVG